MLFLEGLEVPCRVGCSDPERATPQSLRVGVRLYCASLREAGIADDLEQTVDYRLAGEMIDAVQGKRVPADRARRRGARRGGSAQSAGATTSRSRSRSGRRCRASNGRACRSRGAGATRPPPSLTVKVVSNTAISLDGRINTRERRFAFFGSDARPCTHEPAARRGRRGAGRRRDLPQLAASGAARRRRSAAARGPAVERGRQPLARPADGRRLLHRAGGPAAASWRAPLAGQHGFPAEAEGWAGDGDDLPIGWILERSPGAASSISWSRPAATCCSSSSPPMRSTRCT